MEKFLFMSVKKKKIEFTSELTVCILWKLNFLKLASESAKHKLSELFLKLPPNASQLGSLLIIPSSSHHKNFKGFPQPLSSALGSFYLFTKPFTRLGDIENSFHLFSSSVVNHVFVPFHVQASTIFCKSALQASM